MMPYFTKFCILETYCRLNDMFYSIYTDVGDYMPSYSKSKDKKDKKDRGRDRDRDDHRDRGKDRDRDRDRDYRDRDRDRRDRGRDRDRHSDRDRDRERDGHRDRRDDRKRKSYFEKPVEEVCSTQHSVPSCLQCCRHLFFQDNLIHIIVLVNLKRNSFLQIKYSFPLISI